MKRVPVLFFLVVFLLVSCKPVETPHSEPAAIQPTIRPSLPPPTFISPTVTPGLPSATATPQLCDPLAVDFCIAEGHFVFQSPIRPPANTSVDISYRYGTTANGARDPHHGVEFVNRFGTPVHAAGDGVVLFADLDEEAIYSPWPNFYGKVVVIEHADDLYTLYAHLSSITVGVGQTVFGGEQIGEVGQSGVAIGPHLHFEVRRGDAEDYYSTENPELWLSPNQDENGKPFGVMEISIVDQEGHLVKYTEFTAQFFQEQSQPSSTTYYGVTYPTDMLNGKENAALGDVPAGYYRIVLKYNGQLYERWVEVESRKLTQAIIVVK